MKTGRSVLICLVVFLMGCQQKITYKKFVDKVEIALPNGSIGVYPLSDNTIRIKYLADTLEMLPELIFTSPHETPEFDVNENSSDIEIKTKKVLVKVHKKTGTIKFKDHLGNTFLSEITGSRILKKDSILGEPCYFAEQSFHSPSNETIFGLGQFQDGNYNLKGITRRLTQVNSQIALPFIYSSRGYGLLWHQYGLTEFNPTDQNILLEKQELTNGQDRLVEVTTTAGTQKISQNQTLYIGEFSVPTDGEYSLFLDLTTMGNRHFVAIDGIAVFDQTNLWLPPTAGTLVDLKAGTHQVQLICKSNNIPFLSWRHIENTTTFRSPVTKKLDYIVFYGPEADSVIASYRKLTGNAPLFPKWAYGYWQCRERYTSSEQLVETVKEFRKRKLPMDVIVQDWQYWGSRGWGVPQFDEFNYPNPSKFIQEIHDLNAHLNISIWSNPDKNSELGKEYVKKNRFIPGTKWLDYFNPATQKEYWETLKTNMFDYGVDSWWMDAVEPENDALKGERTYQGLGDFYRLTYPLMVSKAVYEGQRETTSDKRVCILTRSAFPGQQRYAIINWSGDIGGDWDSYKRQIVAGLNYSITGMPYWTTDIGGFFRRGNTQYTNENYHELLTRWFQWGAFNPIFRMHGYQSETEPWKYGPTVEENMRKMLNLRYQLIPYIYSEAWQITNHGSTLMRPLVMDFREDSEAIEKPYEYMFGKSILVAPIIEHGIKEHQVYLPENSGWYDFWTGKYFLGGQTITTNVSLDKIPLYVKAGSVIPMGKIKQYTSSESDSILEIYIYSGKDGEFLLYEDEGDNYNYQHGKYSTIHFIWDNSKRVLSIGDRQGAFQGMDDVRIFNLKIIGNDKKVTKDDAEHLRNIAIYKGDKLNIKL